MKKKFMAMCMTAILCISCLAGCGNKNSTKNTEEDFSPKLDAEASVTINIIGSLQNFEALEAAINDFNEYYPNYEILYTYMDNYSSLLEERLQNDDTVDIFLMDNNIQLNDYISDTCLNLLDTDIDLSAINSDVIDSCTTDGILYQLPLALNVSGMIVNNTLLEKEGISVPTNNEELLAACEKLKAAGYVPLQGAAYSCPKCFIRNMFYVELSSMENRDEIVESLTNGKDGSAEVARDELELLKTYLDNGYISEDTNNTYEDDYNDAILKFFEGDVPFLVTTAETYSGTKKRETKSEHFSSDPFEYSFVCIPNAEDGAYYYIENWRGFSINKNSSHVDEATEFIRFLATEKEINQIAEIKGLPSVAVNQTDERFTSIYQGSEANTYINDYYYPLIIEEGLYDACEELIESGSIDDAVSEMEKTLKEGE